MVGTRTAIYLVETKYRKCERISGGETEPRWTAHYGRRRHQRHEFQNPLLQADRQRRFVIDLLDAKGARCDVYRSVVITAAGSVPGHLGVFDTPRALARWMATHAKRREARHPDMTPGWHAFETIVASSRSGTRATIAHVWRLGQYRQALKYAATAASTLVAIGLIGTALAWYAGKAVTSPALLEAPATIAEATTRRSGAPTPTPRPPALETSNRCRELGRAKLWSHVNGELHFVRTGPAGELVRRQEISVDIVIMALAAYAQNRDVETIVFAHVDTLERNGVDLGAIRVWLPCSGDGDLPLDHAIDGRLVGRLATAPRWTAGLNAIGIDRGAIAEPLDGEHRRVDWVAFAKR